MNILLGIFLIYLKNMQYLVDKKCYRVFQMSIIFGFLSYRVFRYNITRLQEKNMLSYLPFLIKQKKKKSND